MSRRQQHNWQQDNGNGKLMADRAGLKASHHVAVLLVLLLLFLLLLLSSKLRSRKCTEGWEREREREIEWAGNVRVGVRPGSVSVCCQLEQRQLTKTTPTRSSSNPCPTWSQRLRKKVSYFTFPSESNKVAKVKICANVLPSFHLALFSFLLLVLFFPFFFYCFFTFEGFLVSRCLVFQKVTLHFNFLNARRCALTKNNMWQLLWSPKSPSPNPHATCRMPHSTQCREEQLLC